MCSPGRVESKTPLIIVYPSATKKTKRLEVPNVILLGPPISGKIHHDGACYDTEGWAKLRGLCEFEADKLANMAIFTKNSKTLINTPGARIDANK